MTPPASLGADFAHALAAKDFERISGLLHPEIDFRGLTPRRSWEASSGDEVISDVLRGDFVVEQQAYLSGRDGRIGWMRVVCSGYRPVGEAG